MAKINRIVTVMAIVLTREQHRYQETCSKDHNKLLEIACAKDQAKSICTHGILCERHEGVIFSVFGFANNEYGFKMNTQDDAEEVLGATFMVFGVACNESTSKTVATKFITIIMVFILRLFAFVNNKYGLKNNIPDVPTSLLTFNQGVSFIFRSFILANNE